MNKRLLDNNNNKSRKDGNNDIDNNNNNDDEEDENLIFEDPFGDEFEEEELYDDDNENGDDDINEDDNEDGISHDDMMAIQNQNEDIKQGPKEVWRPGLDQLNEGEELDFDPSAYIMYHSFRTEWPCLSFDILKDNLGDNRQRFPMTMYMVTGSQADKGDKMISLQGSSISYPLSAKLDLKIGSMQAIGVLYSVEVYHERSICK